MTEKYSSVIVSIYGVSNNLLQQHALPLANSVEQVKQLTEKNCKLNSQNISHYEVTL